jgi:transposase, IS5 family
MQMKTGETAIANIKFDIRTRDEIARLLIGLKAIHGNPEVRKQIFEVLTELIPSHVDPKKAVRAGIYV